MVVRERPLGWPYWEAVPISVEPARASGRSPLPLTSFEKADGAAEAWKALAPAERAQIQSRGFTVVRPRATSFAVGEFYEQLVCDGVPSLVTVDALIAIALRAVGAALTDAETHVSSEATRTLLGRLDIRLTAAEPRAHPDLTAGLQVAEGVVAVGLRLLDRAYVVPPEVNVAVAAELSLVHTHAGRAMSPILHIPLDYTVFAARGAAHEDAVTYGAYLAAQWLATASFDFAPEQTERNAGRSDVGSARARTRAALLVARLIAGASDADAPARQALGDIEQLDDLVFGDAAGTSPTAFATLVAASRFDLHDAVAIGDPVALDRIRRVADKAVGSMELLPLRLAPESRVMGNPVDAGPSASEPSGLDVTRWLAASSDLRWRSTASTSARTDGRHFSCYTSALDAIATWLAVSVADGALPCSASRAWNDRKVEGALAAWTLLRHESVPYARTGAATSTARKAPPSCSSASVIVMIEPHPEAIAALLGFVRQVAKGLAAIHALDANARSLPLLSEVQTLLERALRATEQEANSRGSALLPRHVTDLQDFAARFAAIEAQTSPAAGPFSAVVYSDGKAGRALEEGTTGINALYAVVSDPRTGRPTLAVGAALAHAEIWVPAREAATDIAWATRLASSNPPVGDRFAGTVEAP